MKKKCGKFKLKFLECKKSAGNLNSPNYPTSITISYNICALASFVNSFPNFGVR